MAHRINNSPVDKIAPALYWGTVVLTILGVADALYLLVYKLSGNPLMCLGNGGCHNVNFSAYSEINGIPVSVFGMCAYLAILCILIFGGTCQNRERKWSAGHLRHQPGWRGFHSLLDLS